MKEIIELKEPLGKVLSASDLFGKIKQIAIDYCQENFIVFYLNTSHQIIDAEVVFKGGLGSCLIDPKTLFRKALLRNAHSLIVAHNHPSGNLNPSTEDEEVYATLCQAGDVLGLKLLNSIIFNKTSFYSIPKS